MRIHLITDNAVERIEFKVGDDQYALVRTPKNTSWGSPKTVIMNQEEALVNLHSAIHEEEALLKKKGEICINNKLLS